MISQIRDPVTPSKTSPPIDPPPVYQAFRRDPANEASDIDNSKMTLVPWKKKTITILLIGETGVGKTAFLDLLANVCAGRKFEDFAPVHVKTNEAGGSSAGSQTNEPKLYTIICANGHEVRVLDTPGLADTRGIDYDNRHKEAIAEAIKTKAEVIDSIIILANGTQERLGVATEYTLAVIAGMFPNSIINNIAFLFTMVANPLQFNFRREALHPCLRQAKIWTIDNPLAGWLKYHSHMHSKYPPDQEFMEEMFDVVQSTYAKTLKTLNAFFRWQDERQLQPTKEINDLYQMTQLMEAAISNILGRLNQQEDEMKRLVKVQNDIAAQRQWVKTEKTETTEDSEAKSRYEKASSEVERIAILKEQIDQKIVQLRTAMVTDEESLSRLCYRYNKLALSGSFSGHIAHAINLLRIRYEKIKKEGSDADSLERMNDRIESLQKKKKIVEEATRRNTAKVGVLSTIASYIGITM
ncbi:hypothetical protein ONZ45_g1292 [Pleurotus djamor]|nr:hypothetical protein ONZ45_g1292 [Pleurotus djamor]